MDSGSIADAAHLGGLQLRRLRQLARQLALYKMDTGMGDSTYCNADEAEEHWRAHEATEIELKPKLIYDLYAEAFPNNTDEENNELMQMPGDYLVNKKGEVFAAIVSENIDSELWIKALVANPQRRGYGTIMLDQLFQKLEPGKVVYVQSAVEAVDFYVKNSFVGAEGKESCEHCTAMQITTPNIDDIYLRDGFIKNGYKFSESDIDQLKPNKRKRESPASVTTSRKRVRKSNYQRAAWTNLGRGVFRKQGGTAVCGPVGEEQRTCLPDATYVCIKYQGGDVTLTEARSYMPDEGDASIEDMKQFALENGFKIVSAGNFSSNPLKTLKLMSGHYIVLITLTDKDGDVHKHACALTEHNGAMFIVDNKLLVYGRGRWLQ